MALKFYIIVEKELIIKVIKFSGLIPTFLEGTREKLAGETFLPPSPPPLNRVNRKFQIWTPMIAHAGCVNDVLTSCLDAITVVHVG